MTKALDWKRITIYVLPEEHKRIRMSSFEENTSTSEYIRNILLKTLKTQDKKTE
jgi:hypothetical protein